MVEKRGIILEKNILKGYLMNKLKKEMPSIKKLQDEIKSMKWIGLLGGKELKNSIKKSEEKFNICIEQINLFNTNFSDNGWIA